VGVVIGVAMARSKEWERFWNPLISLTYPVPKVGLVPLFILWLGLGEASKLAVVFTGAVYPVIINTYSGIKGIPEVLLWRGHTLGANRRETLVKIVLPYALPHILNGLRLAMGLAWVLVFAAEMVAARRGLGFMILQAEQMFQSDVVFAGLVTIALLGFVFDRIILGLSHHFCGWYFRRSGEGRS
jgi:ABC-type nitrate/sulfonate/bicarbonate transport system permease component